MESSAAIDSSSRQAGSSTVKRDLQWVVATALFMEQLDSTIINTAVPSMADSCARGALEP